jgi:RNA-directed DNA polymerase
MHPQERSEKLVSVPKPLNLFSVSHLQAILGHSFVELDDLSSHAVKYYSPFHLREKPRPFSKNAGSKKVRFIDRPVDPLKAIQARIEARILKKLILPEHLLGGVRGKSILDNARQHLNARYLVTIDIKNFFPSITPLMVNSVWRKPLNCSPKIAYVLTGLTTCRNRLPQGAPTSTLLANLVLGSKDGEIRDICEKHGVNYSSWLDDLAFSGDSSPRILGQVITRLANAGFRVSHQKIKLMGPHDRKILNNLVLGRFVTVKREYLGQIRAGIHNLSRGRLSDSEVLGHIESLKGSINFLRLFDQRKADRLLNDLRVAVEGTVAQQPS